MWDRAEDEDVVEVFEAVHWESFRRAAGCEDEFGVGVAFAGGGGDRFFGEVDGGDGVGDRGDAGGVVPGLGPEGEFGGVGDEGFGELGPVNGEVGFC